MDQMTEQNRLHRKGCSYCANRHSPLDRHNQMVGNSYLQLNDTIRNEVTAWLADLAGF